MLGCTTQGSRYKTLRIRPCRSPGREECRVIRPKKRVRREFWRTGKIREDGIGMARLRSAAYARSEGICECGLCPGRPPCLLRASWSDGQLHHILSRAHGGSDVIENVAFINRICHHEI